MNRLFVGMDVHKVKIVLPPRKSEDVLLLPPLGVQFPIAVECLHVNIFAKSPGSGRV